MSSAKKRNQRRSRISTSSKARPVRTVRSTGSPTGGAEASRGMLPAAWEESAKAFSAEPEVLESGVTDSSELPRRIPWLDGPDSEDSEDAADGPEMSPVWGESASAFSADPEVPRRIPWLDDPVSGDDAADGPETSPVREGSASAFSAEPKVLESKPTHLGAVRQWFPWLDDPDSGDDAADGPEMSPVWGESASVFSADPEVLESRVSDSGEMPRRIPWLDESDAAHDDEPASVVEAEPDPVVDGDPYTVVDSERDPAPDAVIAAPESVVDADPDFVPEVGRESVVDADLDSVPEVGRESVVDAEPISVLAWVDERDRTEAALEPSEPSRRRPRVLVLAGVCLAVLLAAGLATRVWNLRDSAPQPEGSGVAGSSVRFSPPVTLANDTSYVQTQVLPSGDLVVSHWIRVDRPLSTLQITVPSVAGLPESAVGVDQMYVAVDGTHVVNPAPDSDHTTWTVPLGGAHSVYLRYRLAGVFQRDTPTSTRGIARITSLQVDPDVALAGATTSVVGADVLALACSKAAPEAVPVPCGGTVDGRWQTRLASSHVDDRVMAQLDLSGSL